jgi:hypothetical protein
MNTMNMPGFTAEATLDSSNKPYQSAMRHWSNQQVVPQSPMTCAFKAGRLAGRCLALGLDNCYELAADFYKFCNDYDL